MHLQDCPRFSKICKFLQDFPTWGWAMTIQNPYSFTWASTPQPSESPTGPKAGQQLQHNQSEPFQRWKSLFPTAQPSCYTWIPVWVSVHVCLKEASTPAPDGCQGKKSETKSHVCNLPLLQPRGGPLQRKVWPNLHCLVVIQTRDVV